LREEGCLWLIKCPDYVSLGDVEHFNTPLTYGNFGQTRVYHWEGNTIIIQGTCFDTM
jgi:hypothetical protein